MEWGGEGEYISTLGESIVLGREYIQINWGIFMSLDYIIFIMMYNLKDSLKRHIKVKHSNEKVLEGKMVLEGVLGDKGDHYLISSSQL